MISGLVGLPNEAAPVQYWRMAVVPTIGATVYCEMARSLGDR